MFPFFFLDKKPRPVLRINNSINYFYLQKPVTKQIDYTIYFFEIFKVNIYPMTFVHELYSSQHKSPADQMHLIIYTKINYSQLYTGVCF